MRKREVIELRYRIDRVSVALYSWESSTRNSRYARLGKHTGVQEHGIPDIVIFRIPGRPGQFRKKKTVGSIGQCNGEYERRLLRSRIRS